MLTKKIRERNSVWRSSSQNIYIENIIDAMAAEDSQQP
jgi:hypothetical protein